MSEQSPKASEKKSDETKHPEYKALRPHLRKFHGVGPKDIPNGKPEEVLFHVQIQMETGHGEQMAIQVPVFVHDSREQVRDRVNLALSIPQERKEDFGAAVDELNQMARDAREQERQRQISAQQAAKMEKLAKKGKLKVVTEPVKG